MELTRKRIRHYAQHIALLGTCGREEPQMTVAQAKNRYLAIPDDACRAQKRPVSAERDDQVGAVDVGHVLYLGSLIGSPYDLIALTRKPKLEHKTALDCLLLVIIRYEEHLHSCPAFLSTKSICSRKTLPVH